MKISTGFNPEKKELVFIVETNLLTKYYSNLKGLIEDKPGLPKGIKVTKRSDDTAEISFSVEHMGDGVKIGESSMAIEDKTGEISKVHLAIKKFTAAALRKEFKSTEFVPLRGYPQEDVIKDVRTARENKRNLMLIKDYSEYLDGCNNENGKYQYNQYLLEYGTSEWADVVIDILSPGFKIENLEKRYSHKLKETNWL